MGIRCWIRRFVLKKSNIERGHGCRPVGHSNPHLQQCSELPPNFAADTTMAFEMALCGWQLFFHYTGDTLLKHFHFLEQTTPTCPQKTYPLFLGAFARPTFSRARLLAQMNPGRAFIQRCQVCKQPNANLANLHPITAYDKAQIC